MSSEGIPVPLACGTTTAPEQRLSYRWVIKNANVFVDDHLGNGHALVSPIFDVFLRLQNKTIKAVFHLKLQTNSQYYKVCLRSVPSGDVANDQVCPSVVISKFTFNFLNCDPKKCTNVYGPYKATFIIAKTSESSVFSPSVNSFKTYVHNDTITIQVDGILQCCDNPVENTQSTEVRKTPPDNIRDKLQSMYRNNLFTDVTIECGEKEFKAHKLVLASQSPVFERMLEADMREKSSNVIDVSDVNPQVMEAALAYLYTGAVPDMSLQVMELINVANKYQIARLLEMCEIELNSKIEVNNVIETLLLADLHNSAYLKRACLQFIHLNASEVHKTKEWKDFKASLTKYPALMMEMLEFNDKPEN